MTGKPALPTVALLKLASQRAVETDKYTGILTSFELGKSGYNRITSIEIYPHNKFWIDSLLQNLDPFVFRWILRSPLRLGW